MQRAPQRAAAFHCSRDVGYDLAMFVEGRPEAVIDRMSSSRRLTGAELRDWGTQRAVFISSTMAEFEDERRALATAIEQTIGAEAILFERFGGRDEDAEQAYLDGVRRCDVYLGLIGDRYGTMLPSGRSPTHEEYREAVSLGRRISVWVKDGGESRQGDARDFLTEIRLFHTTGSFSRSDDLVAGVLSRLKEVASEDLSPWVKLGDLCFRARRIVDAGDTLELQADVRDPAISAALLEYRSPAAGGQEVRFTDHVKSIDVRVDGVETSSTSTAVTEFTVRLNQSARGQQSWGQRMTIDGFSPDELVEIGLRHGLFGDEIPQRLRQFGTFGIVEIGLPELGGLSLDSVRAVVRLYLVETLVGGGHATRVTNVLVGGGSRDEYQAKVSWLNADSGEHTVEGAIPTS